MAYGDMTLADLEGRFGLAVVETPGLFAGVPEADLPARLAQTVDLYLPMAVGLSTEKGRSELLVGPLLFELRLLHRDRLSVFSGVDFNVDPAAGLNGRCDFIVAQSPQQLAVRAPVCVVVEAKRDDLVPGLAQCLAGMVAAQRFNAAGGLAPRAVYGAVTSGLLWRFLRLRGATAEVDDVEYPIQLPKRLFGVLLHIALSDA